MSNLTQFLHNLHYTDEDESTMTIEQVRELYQQAEEGTRASVWCLGNVNLIQPRDEEAPTLINIQRMDIVDVDANPRDPKVWVAKLHNIYPVKAEHLFFTKAEAFEYLRHALDTTTPNRV